MVNIVHSEEAEKFTAANNFQNKEITAFTSIPPLQRNSSSFRNLDEFPLPSADSRCLVYECKRPILPFQCENDMNIDKTNFCTQFQCSEEVSQWIQGCTEQQFKTLVKFIPTRNGRFATCNQVLTCVTGSNTATYVLGSAEVAKAVLFYLVKYLTKTALDNTISIAIVAAVNEKNKKYPSVADDAESAERNAKLFVARCVNLMYGKEEIPVTQAACLLLDLPFNQASERTYFLFIWAYIRHYRFTRSQGNSHAKEKNLKVDSDDERDDDDDNKKQSYPPGEEDHPQDDIAEGDRNDPEADDYEQSLLDIFGTLEAPPESFDETATVPTAYRFGNCSSYDTIDDDNNPKKIAISSEELYYSRGTALQYLSPYAYVSIIEVRPITSEQQQECEDDEAEADDDGVEAVQADKPRRVGRRASKFFQFDDKFALHRTHVQTIRSKQVLPVLAHPPCPKFVNSQSKHAANRRDEIAEYLLALFSPSDLSTNLPMHGHTWADLIRFIKQLLHIAPGSNQSSFVGYCTFECMKNVSVGLSANFEINVLSSKYRFRSRTVWENERNSKPRADDDVKVFEDDTIDIYNDVIHSSEGVKTQHDGKGMD